MSDLAVIVLALSTAAGAVAARPIPLPIATVVVSLGFVRRSPVLVCVGALLLASALSARAWAGLRPAPPREWSGVATLVSDPGDAYGAVTVDLRVGHRRVEAWARGEAAGRLRDRLSGERVAVVGRLEPLPPGVRHRLARRHIAGRLIVERVGGWAPGGPVSRVANGVRRTLLAGVASLPAERRGLFAGFVLGDDREQSIETVDDFRASGLAHLLVVSGQNVAFVLALASPLLRRLSVGARLVAGIFVLVVFGFITRWEPSVLRAEAMAGIALLASTLARPVSGVRVLALAVTAVLLLDPLLVGSVSLQLSVGVSAGIVLFAVPIAAALPGPRPIASALSVTLAAQIGVAPVLVPFFGGLPVVAVPANLLAVPAAGPVMMWGLAAGLPAGVWGGSLARIIHAADRVARGLGGGGGTRVRPAAARRAARAAPGRPGRIGGPSCRAAARGCAPRALLVTLATVGAPALADRQPRPRGPSPSPRGPRYGRRVGRAWSSSTGRRARALSRAAALAGPSDRCARVDPQRRPPARRSCSSGGCRFAWCSPTPVPRWTSAPSACESSSRRRGR